MPSNSQNPDKTIICPNCGSEAKGNYCYQCGQATHLHDDTLWALILHFLEHYFHYDSKFWQTLKALWFKPGMLTLAYWNKQRARYLSPISLYVFISAVYFIILFMLAPEQAELLSSTSNNKIYNSGKQKISQALSKEGKASAQTNSYEAKYFKITSDPALLVPLVESVMHQVPKIFFFMIPFMALITNILFYGQKKISFIDHTIFAVHIQTFYFSVFLLTSILSLLGHLFLSLKLPSYVLIIIYLTLALKKVYKTSWTKATLFSLIICGSYLVIFCVIIILGIAVLINFT